MFYSDFVLSKKGPLARIWLAAHWDKKLTKAQIFETNIESSIERILRPKVKLALRTSGHLMLGVVRIYSRKTKYLLADCNEAFVKIKMAFRPGMVDLPDDHREAAVNAVTLPEVFHDFDSVMPDLNNMDIEVQFTLNQSRADEITMREDYGTVLPLHSEDAFDLAFDATGSDVLRHSVGFDQSLQQANLLFGEGIDTIERNKDRSLSVDVGSALGHISMDVDLPKDDGFGSMTGGGLFEGGLFEDTPMPSVSNTDNNSLPISEAMGTDMAAIPSTSREPMSRLNDDDDFDDNFGAPSPVGGSSIGSRPQSPLQSMPNEMANISDFNAISNNENLPNEIINQQALQQGVSNDLEGNAVKDVDANEGNENIDQTTLLQNEEESFALAPVNASSLVGLSKSRRKRKLIVDEVKNISGEEMKGQLSDTTDIVTTLDLAPPTKRLMRWKETGGVEKLFALPGKIIPSRALFKNYQRHLVSISAANEDAKNDPDNANEPVFAAPALPVITKRGRKRKRAVNEEEPPQEMPIMNREQNFNQFQFNNNEESVNSVIPNLNAENSISPWSATNQNKEHELHPDAGVSVPESYGGQYSASENGNMGDGMTPWHVTDYQNPPSVRSNLGTNDNPASVPYDMNGNNASPWINAEYQNNVIQPNQNIGDFSAYDNNITAISHNEGNTPRDGMATPWREPDYNMDKTPNTYPSNDDNIHPPMTPGINADNMATPWHDVDYFNPMSVEPAEERGADETVEQFEERILNKRAGHLYSTIRIRISTGTMTTFNDLTMGNVKKQVAQKFYSLLVLKKHKVLELTQEAPYDEVLLTKGANFDDPKL